MLDIRQQPFLPLAAKRDGAALVKSASGSAHSVDVVLGYIRQVVVHDVVYVRDIDPSGADIGGDQNITCSFLKLFHDLESVVLILFAMNRHC